MDKLLLTLTLVAFSSGVLCNVAQNLTEGAPTAESMPSIDKTQLHNTLYKLAMPCTRDVRDDYEVFPGIGAYKLHKRSTKWNDARKTCMSEGGILAILNSDAEGTMLQEWMKRENFGNAWIGVHDLFQQGEWVTLTGETVEAAGYDKWLPGEPNNAYGNEHCAEFEDRGGMNDIACNNTYYYFCKMYIC